MEHQQTHSHLLAEQAVKDFTALLASDAPAPGGGSAAALEGAMGAALTAMVCELTLGKEKYAAYREEIAAIRDKAETLREKLLQAMDEDTEAFLQVSRAFAMAKATDEEKAARSAAIQKGLAQCTETPLHVMELAADTLVMTASLPGRFNESAASDLGVAALSLRACVRGAWLNVLINVGSLKDQDLAAQYRRQGETVLKRAMELADQIDGAIMTVLEG